MAKKNNLNKKEENQAFGLFEREKDKRRKKLNKDYANRSRKWQQYNDDDYDEQYDDD